MNKKVIYTAIFGGKDSLIDQINIPKDYDWVCFTDSDFKSDKCDVRKVEPTDLDPVRAAKIYKVLPHKYFPDYEYSVWIDGNIFVKKSPDKILEKYLKDANMSFFDHAKQKKRIFKLFWIKDKKEARNCVYQEYDAIMEFVKNGNLKDDPELVKKQIQRYREEEYPEHNGLIASMIMFRRHNEPDVIKTMEDWWNEIKNNSRRDQISFNYVAWKNKLKYNAIPEDSRHNKYFKHTYHNFRKSVDPVKSS